ncbi:hypothetical protein D9756_008454 [Leucocoprinus leucothites]|uniref:Uncharacterized protein n=1 Tax=Leucocoprinus leucothites TaxID=201217 RepID=A0A8H5D1M3_9AGAR|nr:hypothetical protein D9756_008454 [Leucoagaricus leucothites]
MASENLFFSLPQKTQKRIDSAFDSVCKKVTTKSSELDNLPAGGFIPEQGGFVRNDEGENFNAGGFIREEESDGGFLRDDSSALGGGFLIEDEDQHNAKLNSQIPLSLIPSALQRLDLPPDDDEILAVFRNAATGWTSSNNEANDLQEFGEEDQFVSRDDWRSVCAVLLEHNLEEHDTPGQDAVMAEPGMESDGGADSDEYRESEVEVEEREDDDGDYIEGPSTSATRRRTRRTTHKPPSSSPQSSTTSSDTQPRKLTSRQRHTCIDAYSLFFPTVSAEELLSQRIMIKDIQRAAKLLNEKLKAQDMVEMLETFSTSPDKSMDFEDFCGMMVKAKLA